MRYSWADLVLYAVATVLLIPLVIAFIESVRKAMETGLVP